MDIERKNLEDFYKEAKSIVLKLHFSKNRAFDLEYIRSNVDSDILKNCYEIGNLSINEMYIIGAKTVTIKLSMDTMVKNILHHSELSIQDYKNIEKYIKNAEYILQSNNKNLIYFKIDNEIYQIVIKTTKDKRENFLTTFHKSSKQQLVKDLKRYKQIKR